MVLHAGFGAGLHGDGRPVRSLTVSRSCEQQGVAFGGTVQVKNVPSVVAVPTFAVPEVIGWYIPFESAYSSTHMIGTFESNALPVMVYGSPWHKYEQAAGDVIRASGGVLSMVKVLLVVLVRPQLSLTVKSSE